MLCSHEYQSEKGSLTETILSGIVARPEGKAVGCFSKLLTLRRIRGRCYFGFINTLSKVDI